MPIAQHSPHLEGLKKRLLGDKSPGLLDLVFDFAIEAGGLDELDFTREPEASYNPRPARIAVILMQTAGVRNGEVIASGILASAIEFAREKDPKETLVIPPVLQAEVSAGVISLARQAADELWETNDHTPTEAKLIANVLWLDRARHLHLSKDKKTVLRVFEQSDRFTAIAAEACPSLEPIVKSWKAKFERTKSYQEAVSFISSQKPSQEKI